MWSLLIYIRRLNKLNFAKRSEIELMKFKVTYLLVYLLLFIDILANFLL